MDWIHYIKTDENQALKEIYTLHRNSCIKYLITAFDCTLEDALDIFQLSVVILYDNVMTNKLTELTSDVQFYLNSIAKNKARELIRNRKPTQSIDDNPVILKYISDSFENEDLEEQLISATSAIEKLGDPCKTLLELYYFDDLGMEEIGHKLGYKNTDTVKTQKYKCLKRLQTIYFDHINVKKIEKH
ncbi:MAG: sigma-70 family RNA polymerase sigma factor [Saprospiraceae bacterium]